MEPKTTRPEPIPNSLTDASDKYEQDLAISGLHGSGNQITVGVLSGLGSPH